MCAQVRVDDECLFTELVFCVHFGSCVPVNKYKKKIKLSDYLISFFSLFPLTYETERGPECLCKINNQGS